jgi:protein Tex
MELNEEFINGLLINQAEIERKISEELTIPIQRVRATVDLLKEGSTIPFISRYRKEATGSLDEVQVRDINHQMLYHENIETRRIEIIKGIFSQGKLSEDIYTNIAKATTYAELEDLYAPFKKKKKTRGMIAIEKGLEPLAQLMLKRDEADIEKEAEKYVDAEKGVNNKEEALQGAQDIVAEQIAHDVDNRKYIKDYLLANGFILIKGLKKEETSVYKMYYDYKEPLKTLKPHRVLAINRGEKEEELEVKIDYDEEDTIKLMVKKFYISNPYQKAAIEDGMKRLLIPAVVREIRGDNSEEADKHGITVFSENLKGLLMQPPIKKTKVLGIDPGIRTGTKSAVLDENGKYLSYFLFYQEKTEESKKMIADAVKKYNIELIAVGNGTGSHDVQKVVSEAITTYNLSAQYTVVSEDGASVYSASDIAREEFPDLDLTVRGAISIGRRIQDPLAELVKIDPKSIGVGLYQHDVNQTALSKAVDEVVESVVNKVGVNVNTASFSLLKYASGITTFVAKNIVEYRDDFGTIKSREELRKIAGFGDKTFEQAAGFLKIPESPDPLDNTWVHPENYEVAREILEILKNAKALTSEQKTMLSKKYDIGETTITDIVEELKKPNRDPRENYPQPIMQKGVVNFDDLKEGMKVKGLVKNVVDFGAFIDLGIKETALIHVSELSNKFVTNPGEILKVGDVKEFTIIGIDNVRKRISLSLKDKKKVNFSDYIIS